MNAHQLKGKIRRRAKFDDHSMANLSMSDSTEPIHPEVFFNNTDEEVGVMIQAGIPIRGHIEWEGGEWTEFVATNVLDDLEVKLGKWEIPE